MRRKHPTIRELKIGYYRYIKHLFHQLDQQGRDFDKATESGDMEALEEANEWGRRIGAELDELGYRWDGKAWVRKE